jgi:NAD(P)-dependent dehydrogenase (short-subunit alcohol dehydrogenase family)
VEKAFEKTKEDFGPVDILVSNAAYFPDILPLAKIDVDEFWKGFEVNVKGNLILSQAFLKHASEKPTLISINAGGAHAPPMVRGFCLSFCGFLGAEFPICILRSHTDLGADGGYGCLCR